MRNIKYCNLKFFFQLLEYSEKVRGVISQVIISPLLSRAVINKDGKVVKHKIIIITKC